LDYEGLILECGFKGRAEYHPPESVLANPHIAPNLAVDSILSDPTGLLTQIQQVVAKEFARRRWVVARSEYEKKRALEHLEPLSQANSLFEVLLGLWWFASFLSGLVAVASLKLPTHRKALVLMKELLHSQDRLDLHERLLTVLGYAYMSPEEVGVYLQECTIAFDRAVAVKRRPSYWGFKLRPHIRPYAIDGAREMMDEGHHREAMYWIEAFFAIALAVIQNDAPQEEKPCFQATFGRLLSDLGLTTPDDWRSRLRQARKLVGGVFKVADDIVAHHPGVID